MQGQWYRSLSRVGFVALSVLLFGLSLSMALPGQANAVPTVFTDRAAFDAAVGETTLLTFDTPPTLGCMDSNCFGGVVTVNDLLTITGDRDAFMSSFGPGAFCFCSPAFELTARTVSPVLAFGLDINQLQQNPQGGGMFFHSGSDGVFISQSQFLGLVFDTPTIVSFRTSFPTLGNYTIDNVAIKTVPEPASLLFLGIALMGFIGWHSLSRKFGQA